MPVTKRPAVPVLGFSALQLSSDLRELVERRWSVRNLPASLHQRLRRVSAPHRRQSAPRWVTCMAIAATVTRILRMHPFLSTCRLAQDVADPASTQKVLGSLLKASAQFRLPGTSTAVPVVSPGALSRQRAADENALTRRKRADAAARHGDSRFRRSGADRALDRSRHASIHLRE